MAAIRRSPDGLPGRPERGLRNRRRRLVEPLLPHIVRSARPLLLDQPWRAARWYVLRSKRNLQYREPHAERAGDDAVASPCTGLNVLSSIGLSGAPRSR